MELSAREIFNRIIKGQIVRIGHDPEVARQLQNHLNVIKSREKKLVESLGFDFLSSVISVESFAPQIIAENCVVDGFFEIKLKAPKKRRSFTCFVIKDNEPTATK